MFNKSVLLAAFVLLLLILGCAPVGTRVLSAEAGTPIVQVDTVPLQPTALPTDVATLPTATASPVRATAAPPPATSPEVTQAPTPWIEATNTVAGDQRYRNDEGGFSILYPSQWQFSELPSQNAGLLKGVRIEGAEGAIELYWGTGFGGMCEENGVNKYVKIQGAQGGLQTCYFKASNGVEQWSQISTPSLRPGFQARAWTNDASATSGELVRKVIATLTFDQP